MAKNTYQLEGTIGNDHYQTKLVTRSHHLVADEPNELGGEDLGPTPDELLLAALASCKLMTMRMYADRKEWPLEKINALLEMEVDRSELPVQSRISCRLKLTGALDAEQQARLVVIADKCPTHRVLTGQIEIESTLA
jgi:putative redox protein